MKSKMKQVTLLLGIMIGLLVGLSSCTEDETEQVRIGNAGKLVAVNIETGETYEKEMYGQNLSSPNDPVNVNFEGTMYVKNGDKIKISYKPNAQCRKYDLEPILVVNDTSTTLKRSNGYEFEYPVKDFEKGERYGVLLLIIYQNSTSEEIVQIVSVGDFALALKDDE